MLGRTRCGVIYLFLLLLLFSGSVCALYAQEAGEDEEGDWFWNKNITEITFEGLKNVRKSELKGITSAFIDKPLTDENYTDLVDRLYALDSFDDISSYVKHSVKSDNDVILVLKVIERPTISIIDFSGNRRIRNGELRESITVKTGDIYIESKALLDERALRNKYLQKGYTAAKVSHKTEETDKGLKLTFVIEEGANTAIAAIRFSGNRLASERTLKKKLTLKEAGIGKAGAFQQSALETDKQQLVAYYADRGYADARVLDVVTEEAYNEKKNRNELTLTFVIQEGAQYTYGGTVLNGNVIFDSKKLLSYIKLKEGDVFNQTKWQEGMQGITGLYAENGYMTNQYIPSTVKDPETKVISFTITIQENSRSHIENIIIKGNTKTKDYVIRREMPLESGDVFNRDKVMTGLRNLYNLQYFSSVVPEPVNGSEADLVNLVITVEEQSTKSLEFGMTFSGVNDPDAFPISLFAKIQNSNLFGEGRTVGANTTIASNDLGIGLNYGQGWTWGKPISWSEGISFDYATNNALRMSFSPDGRMNDDDYYFQYKSFSASISSALGRRWTPPFAIITVNGGLVNAIRNHDYDQSAFVPLDTGVSRAVDLFALTNCVWTSISADDRDVNYDPTTGWFASQKLSWYGLIPGVEKEFFLRTDTKLEAYLRLFNIPVTEKWSFRWVLMAYTGLSLIFPTPDSPLGDNNKVYIDGMFNARGWTKVYSDTRGRAMLSNRVELRMPIVPQLIGIDGFFDAALTTKKPEDLGSITYKDFYYSYGPGIRFLLPQFPLHLIFANCFRWDENGDFEWKDTMKFVLSFNVVNR